MAFPLGLPGMPILRGKRVSISAREEEMLRPARENGDFSARIAGNAHSAREKGIFFSAGRGNVTACAMREKNYYICKDQNT